MENNNDSIKPVKMVPDNNDLEQHNEIVVKEEVIESGQVEAIIETTPSKVSDSYDSEQENYIKELKEKDTTGIYKTIVSDDEIKEELISLPTLPSNILYSYIQESATIKDEQYNKDINIPHTVLTNLGTLPYVIDPAFFKTIVPNKDIKSELTYKDKIVKFEEVNIRGGNKEKAAIDKIRNITRVGKNIQVPLWNTGIRITLIVPPVNAIYDLKKKLRDLNIESDVDAGGLLFSNKKIKLYKDICNFISNYILDTTLDIPEDKTLYDYVSVVDIALTIVGTSLSLYPNGNYVTITCAKSSEIKNGVPKCNYMASSKIDPRDLVKIDSSRVTDTMLDIISRRNSGSVSVDDLITYKNEYIKDTSYNNIVVPYETGDLIFTLELPSINHFLTAGDKWYDELLSQIYNIGNLTYELRKEEIEKIIELSVLGVYNSYVKSVTVEDEIYTDQETIDGCLNEVSQDNYLYNIFMKGVMSFISYHTIANIGTNNFLCPNCKSKQLEEDNIKNIFEMEYIWMDPISYFLEIMNSKLTKMQKRTTN